MRQLEDISYKHEGGRWTLPLLLVAFIAIMVLAFMVGRYPVDPITLVKILLSKILPIEADWAPQAESVVFRIRGPRILTGALIGAGLALAGLSYQSVFQNPMVSPDVLGATSGAAMGSALGLLWGWSYTETTILSFALGLAAVGLTLLIAHHVPSQPVLGMVLSGMMIGSLMNSCLSFVKLVADTEDVLPQITYYLIGSLNSVREGDLLACAIVVGLCSVLTYCLRWPLNVLSQGDEEAHSLGIPVKAIRLTSIISATLMSAMATAVAGTIGWVGLVVPHLTRMIVGCDHRRSIPASILIGSGFLVFVDTLSRSLTTSEIPIGILTSFIGAPFFIYLVIREGRRT